MLQEKQRKQEAERGTHHQMSGRQMFEFKPELFVDAEDGAMGTEELVAENQVRVLLSLFFFLLFAVCSVVVVV